MSEISFERQIRIEGNRISRDDIAGLLTGVLLLLCVFLSEEKLTVYFSAILFLFYLIYAFTRHTIVYLKYLHFIFASVFAVFGCALIETTNVNLYEINALSSFKGSLPLLTFSWWLFLFTIVISDRIIANKTKNRKCLKNVRIKDYFENNKDKNTILITMALVGSLLILFVFVVVSRKPSFLLGLDRFQYAEAFDYGLLYDQALRAIRYLLIPVIVIAVYRNSKIGWLSLIVYCIYSFWVGSKFGSFFSLLCLFTMIFSQKILKDIERHKGKIIGVMIIVMIMGLFSVFAASFTRVEGASNFFIPRTAQQGQLWWKTYSIGSKYNIGEFRDEVQSIKTGSNDIGENVGAQYGIYKVMYNTAPVAVVDNKLSSGSRYTEAGFAAAYYYLGIPGCIIFAIIGGILCSFLVNSFLHYLRYNQYIRAFIYYRFYTYLLVFMSMFTFFPFFNKTSILCYILLLLLHNKIIKINGNQI